MPSRPSPAEGTDLRRTLPSPRPVPPLGCRAPISLTGAAAPPQKDVQPQSPTPSGSASSVPSAFAALLLLRYSPHSTLGHTSRRTAFQSLLECIAMPCGLVPEDCGVRWAQGTCIPPFQPPALAHTPTLQSHPGDSPMEDNAVFLAYFPLTPPPQHAPPACRWFCTCWSWTAT